MLCFSLRWRSQGGSYAPACLQYQRIVSSPILTSGVMDRIEGVSCTEDGLRIIRLISQTKGAQTVFSGSGSHWIGTDQQSYWNL